MSNRDVRIALDYHEETKHSSVSIRLKPHFLDWSNRPYPFKVYTNLPRIPLPQDFPKPGEDTLAALACRAKPSQKTKPMDISRLAELLFFSAGITREIRYPSGPIYFRSAPATGALYPTELYVVNGEIPGLEAGVYHFDPGEFSLTQLRSGDHRAALAEATAGNNGVLRGSVSIVLSSLGWRNAWKYQARSYRHWFWDSGVIAANLLATACSEGFSPSVIIGFNDSQVNQLVGLDGRAEAAVAIVTLGGEVGSGVAAPIREVAPLKPNVKPLSKYVVEYPEIQKLHDASSLGSGEEVAEWLSAAKQPLPRDAPAGAGRPHPLPASAESSSPLWEVILKRGSTRRFARAPVNVVQLATILDRARSALPADFLPDAESSLLDIYLIVNAVDGLPSGSYFHRWRERSLDKLKDGQLRRVAGHLCLEQELGADASIVFFLMSDLNSVLSRYGNRGYRASQFEAGVMAGRIYLAAYALGLGATGLTFYDDDVTEFFSPHAKEKSCVLVVAVGVPAYKARPGKILVGRIKHTMSAN